MNWYIDLIEADPWFAGLLTHQVRGKRLSENKIAFIQRFYVILICGANSDPGLDPVFSSFDIWHATEMLTFVATCLGQPLFTMEIGTSKEWFRS